MSNFIGESLGVSKAPNVDKAIKAIEQQIVSEIYLAGEHIIDAAMSFPSGYIKSVYREGQCMLSPAERLTLCILIFESGYIMTGESIVKDAGRFNVQEGRDRARANAIQKILA